MSTRPLTSSSAAGLMALAAAIALSACTQEPAKGKVEASPEAKPAAASGPAAGEEPAEAAAWTWEVPEGLEARLSPRTTR